MASGFVEEYYRWWFVNTLLKHSLDQALPLIADTSVANCLLRALGIMAIDFSLVLVSLCYCLATGT